jgi:hypothetical protein
LTKRWRDKEALRRFGAIDESRVSARIRLKLHNDADRAARLREFKRAAPPLIGKSSARQAMSTGADKDNPSQAAAESPPREGFASETLNLLSEHKGKLAVGAAAALGLMILYNWREKSLAEEDPEDYARLKKFTAPFKPEDEQEQEEYERRMREEGRRAQR